MDLMVDIETLGTKPTSVILSIGAVLFDEKCNIQEEFYRNISITENYKNEFTVDLSTIEFWKKQPQHIIDSLKSDKRPINEVLNDFSDFCPKDKHSRFWSRGSFDAIILANAYNVIKRDVPWIWWNEMDLRTLTNFFNIKKPKNENAHNALADCRAQVEHLKIILDMLGVV